MNPSKPYILDVFLPHRVFVLKTACVSACIGFLVAGCASGSPSAATQSVLAPMPKAMLSEVSAGTSVITYAAEDIRQRLAAAELLVPFTTYWDANSGRDWKRAYNYEVTDHPVGLEFYLAYHAKAWPLQRLDVIKLELEADAASVRMALHATEPGPGKQPSITYREDKWQRVDGKWKHTITDPLLSVAK